MIKTDKRVGNWREEALGITPSTELAYNVLEQTHRRLLNNGEGKQILGLVTTFKLACTCES